MPPNNMRFSGIGPMPPYHPQQFQHNQPHHPGANPSYINSNGQMNPFSNVQGNSLAMAANANFGMADPSRIGYPNGNFQQQQQHGGQQQQQQQQQVQQHVQSTPQQHVSAQQQHHHQPHHQHQQQQAHLSASDFAHAPQVRSQPNKGRIREVWNYNLHEEMSILRALVHKYPYIAMDTEFPGVVSRPMGNFRGKSDYHYQCLRTNVDMLKVIQIGITLFNEDGETPPPRLSPDDLDPLVPVKLPTGACPYSWQFNFQFSLRTDMYNEKSIESLQTAGIDFNVLERDGIDPKEFAALLIPSGLVCFDDVKWISFHGGYDFGYLTKLLICEQLPNDEVDFDRLMKLYFPATYDVKHLMKHAIKIHNLGHMMPIDPTISEILVKFEHKSGLENIAETLKIKRVGSAHQAGSDSLLTGKVFFQMRQRIFRGEIPEDHIGKVWGLNIPDSGFLIPTITAGNGNDGSMNVNGGGYNAGNGNGPSTPNTSHATLANTTPSRQVHNMNGMMTQGQSTPGGSFGNFSMASAPAR
ncbi:hypothetical protein TD95_002926 [Thielaviopsis punctulata]|uniref:poly(A)-specific ribonuclease n=1 Tax=Thielaviopsis punctulata TaxID=72032 RepID=A0A0F4Z7V7_9PEZI|nr:hypothetical protein TD95_002926 [Thielaviopsis punctulata]